MDRCSCGRPVNHRMHGKCLACRYEEEMEKTRRICAACGKSFYTTLPQKVTCSQECSKEYARKQDRERKRMMFHPERFWPIQVVCEGCGKSFAGNRRSRWCPECRNSTTRQCKVCGKQFTVDSPKSGKVVCSPECRKKATSWAMTAYYEKKRPKARAQKKQPTIPPSTPEEVLASPSAEGWSGTVWLKPKIGGRATLRIAPDKLPYRGEPTRESRIPTWEDMELERMYKSACRQAESP